MSRRSLWLACVTLGCAAAGAAYLHITGVLETPAAAPAATAATAPAERIVTVEAKRVEVDTVLEEIRAVGTLRPEESVVVSPEIAGRIARIRFKESDTVEAGDVLVELDATILRAELAKTQADLTLARANHQRATTLARQGTGTLRARDEAIAALQAAQASHALAEARLEKTSIAAPLSGVVGLRSVSVGAYVTPGDRIVELADIDPIKVDFRVPELVLSSLRPGQRIRVTVDAFPGKTFEGEIYAIDPLVDVNGRAVRLRARIPNPDRLLSPGLFARVQVVIDRRNDAVLVPESAVFPDGEKTFVYRVIANRAVRTEVRLGQRLPGRVEVLAGLDPESVVVTAGHQQLRTDSRVDVVKPVAGR